ncbi:MAG: gliding motility-associated C-terminal domain-containing protein [Salibacteraceae bacterium]|nr:gliding motility-associated C-terminal domain-containing protein [Salibacteraceae bacterium]
MELTSANCESLYYAPTGFTPNGDGLNDAFKIVTDITNGFSLRVFDRWGTLLFESDKPDEGWNGIHPKTSLLMQNGNYSWQLVLTDYDNESQVYLG